MTIPRRVVLQALTIIPFWSKPKRRKPPPKTGVYNDTYTDTY